MNSWNNENYQMMPSVFMVENMSVPTQQPLIGPVLPDTVNLEPQILEPDSQKDVKSLKKRSRSRDRSDHRRNRDRSKFNIFNYSTFKRDLVAQESIPILVINLNKPLYLDGTYELCIFFNKVSDDFLKRLK